MRDPISYFLVNTLQLVTVTLFRISHKFIKLILQHILRLLFFITFICLLPRSLFPENAIDSGFYLSVSPNQILGNVASNMSFPLYTEAYTSGGILISFLVLLLMPIYTTLLDTVVLRPFVTDDPFDRTVLSLSSWLSRSVFLSLPVSKFYIFRRILFSAFSSKYLLIAALQLFIIPFKFLLPPRYRTI